MPRKKLPEGKRRKLRQVRMTDAEWAVITEAAERLGCSMADLIREAALKAAGRALKRP